MKKLFLLIFFVIFIFGLIAQNSSVLKKKQSLEKLLAKENQLHHGDRSKTTQALVEALEKAQSKNNDVVLKNVVRYLPLTRDKIHGESLTNIKPHQVFNPFHDLYFDIDLATTMGYDFGSKNFGFGYYFSPQLNYYYGPSKKLNFFGSQKAFYAKIIIKNFRIQSYGSTLGNNYDNVIYFNPFPYNTDKINSGGTFIPIFTMGNVKLDLGGYGFQAQIALQSKIKLTNGMPYGTHIDVYSPLLKYGQPLSSNSLEQYFGLNAGKTSLALSFFHKYYGFSKNMKVADIADRLNQLGNGSSILFLTDGVSQSVNNYLGEGPGVNLSYRWKNNVKVNFALASLYNFFGSDFSKENENRIGLLFKIKILNNNHFAKGFSAQLAYDMVVGGSSGLGGGSKMTFWNPYLQKTIYVSGTNKPLGLSFQVAYKYSILHTNYYLRPLAGMTFSIKTSHNSYERTGYSFYSGITLGFPIGFYDNGIPFYKQKHPLNEDMNFKGNPIFSNSKYRSGLTIAFNYVKEPFSYRKPYYNMHFSFVHPYTAALLPGTEIIISYELAHINLSSFRQALEWFLGYYATTKIEVYVGMNMVFKGKTDYTILDILNCEYASNMPSSDSNWQNHAPLIKLYDKKAQAYVKIGILFRHIFPYTSFLLQYASDELMQGYTNLYTLNKEKAGAITLTVKADL